MYWSCMPCPKGIPDSECSGHGNPDNCVDYDARTKKCYALGPNGDALEAKRP